MKSLVTLQPAHTPERYNTPLNPTSDSVAPSAPLRCSRVNGTFGGQKTSDHGAYRSLHHPEDVARTCREAAPDHNFERARVLSNRIPDPYRVLLRDLVMPKMKPVSVASAVAVSLFLGCGAGAPSREDEAAKLKAKLLFVEAASCLGPATQKECDPGLAAAFEPGSAPKAGLRVSGLIWCEGGRPHARISTPSGDVEGELGQVVWEAIWRVLKATDSCASAFGGAVSVRGDGQTLACKDPRFDMSGLFSMAYVEARRGPPIADWDTPICQLEPDACPGPAPALCPPFHGDRWNGVRAKRDDDLNRSEEP